MLLAIPKQWSGDAGSATSAVALQVGGVIAGCWTIAFRAWNGDRAIRVLRSPVVIASLLFLAWQLISAYQATLKVHAAYEVLRQLGAMLLFFGIAWGLPPAGVRRMLPILALAAAAGALPALVDPAVVPGRPSGGAWGDPQLLGAVMAIFLPLLACLVRGEEKLPWRLLYVGALTLVVMALILAASRSAWMGALAGLTAAAVLYWSYGRRRAEEVSARTAAAPALAAVLAMAIFLSLWGLAGQVAGRVTALTAPAGQLTVNWRSDLWQSAFLMMREKPIVGWGPGGFPVHQALFSVNSPDQRSLLLNGTGLEQNAHNTYLQMGAESGVLGPILYIAVWCAFLWCGESALRRRPSLYWRCAIIGAMAAVVAHLASAVGSPAWEYSACSGFVWMIAGAGLLAMRGAAASGLRPVRTPAAGLHVEGG